MLRLLSYNVLEGARPDRLPQGLEVIRSAEADVVAIQEARHWRRKRRETFREVGRQLGMRGLLFEANSGFDLALFSRLPVLKHRNLGLDTVFLHTAGSIDLQTASGQVLTLFVAHLRLESHLRRQELKLLLEWMRPYSKRLCAMCGDLNSLAKGDYVAKPLIRPGSEFGRGPQGTIARIERAGWVDCFRKRNPAAPGLTLGAGRRVARVDYIFASRPLAERLRNSKVARHPAVLKASDHSPVWAEFDI